jgi:hypothetical protein
MAVSDEVDNSHPETSRIGVIPRFGSLPDGPQAALLRIKEDKLQ